MRKRITLTIFAAILGLVSIPQIFPAEAETYPVKEGETFSSIATQDNMSKDSLPNELPSLEVQKSLLEEMLIDNTIEEENHNGQADQTAPQNVVQMASGSTTTYKQAWNMRATAYTAHPSENGWGPVDALGNALKLGTVAVDPKVVPLGTKLYITGYRFKHLPKGGMVAVASDTGRVIKGKKIDIFVPVSKKTGNTFGVQDVTVYILK